jgi:hypothetical protein
VTLDEKKQLKVFLDPLDKEMIESKLEAISHIYQKLTTRSPSISPVPAPSRRRSSTPKDSEEPASS